jgi:apolipoprotein N-acyltransferase
MKGLAHRVILSSGWTRFLLAFAAGAAGALAMPPLGVLPALAVAMPVAVWLLDGAAEGGGRFARGTLLTSAWIGWSFGFGYFVAGLWWLGAAFLVEPDQFALLMPLGVLGLPAGLALFPALGFVLARLLWSPGAARLFALAVGLGVSEWLRGTVLTGFPWNDFGMALGTHLALAQGAGVVGLHGLTLLAVLVCATPATLGTGGDARARWLPPALGMACLVALSGFGLWRLSGPAVASVPGVKLRIVQPNVPQDDKFRPENASAIMSRYVALSDRATSPQRTGIADVTHLVWPESAFPFVLAREPAALAQIGRLLPSSAVLVTGAVRMAEPLPGEKGRRFYNAIQVVGHDGVILDSSDKVHLVPFGEYLPLSGPLTSLGLRQFVNAPGGFEAGVRRKMLRVPGLPPVSPLVCYEAIFPGEVRPAEGEPGVLLNVTNDAWFGTTPGPWQHFAQARLRTIEEGLPLVRAANSGISAVVDPFGRITAQLPLGVEGVIDADLPGTAPPTLFTRFPFLYWIELSVFLICSQVRRRGV